MQSFWSDQRKVYYFDLCILWFNVRIESRLGFIFAWELMDIFINLVIIRLSSYSVSQLGKYVVIYSFCNFCNL